MIVIDGVLEANEIYSRTGVAPPYSAAAATYIIVATESTFFTQWSIGHPYFYPCALQRMLQVRGMAPRLRGHPFFICISGISKALD
jgi:hypothetical protein